MLKRSFLSVAALALSAGVSVGQGFTYPPVSAPSVCAGPNCQLRPVQATVQTLGAAIEHLNDAVRGPQFAAPPVVTYSAPMISAPSGATCQSSRRQSFLERRPIRTAIGNAVSAAGQAIRVKY